MALQFRSGKTIPIINEYKVDRFWLFEMQMLLRPRRAKRIWDAWNVWEMELRFICSPQTHLRSAQKPQHLHVIVWSIPNAYVEEIHLLFTPCTLTITRIICTTPRGENAISEMCMRLMFVDRILVLPRSFNYDYYEHRAIIKDQHTCVSLLYHRNDSEHRSLG